MYNIWRSLFQGENREREVKQDLLEIENRLLDQAVAEEETGKEKYNKNANNRVNEEDLIGEEVNGLVTGSCSSRRGVISRLNEFGGIIDGVIHFEKKAAIQIYEELNTGCVVEYISYKNENMETKVIKILDIVESNWNETSTVTKVTKVKQFAILI